MLSEIATFLHETPADEWEDTWWNAVQPQLPIEDAVAAAHAFIDLANAIEEFHEREQSVVTATPINAETNLVHTIQEKINEILNRPQVAQRTDTWYSDGLKYLTASQFGTLYASPRTRAALVLEKAGINVVEKHGQRLVTTSDMMTPFDWGIRFEPVVRAIYSDLTQTVVADVGRLFHKTLERLAASPDGLVIRADAGAGASPSRLGRLVEYKAPVSRKLVQKIPSEYYMQMQIQMEVADIDHCDYCEIKFYSAYNDKMRTPFQKQSHYRGYVALIMKDGVLDRYEYSPLNPGADWTYVAEEGVNERVYERIEWWLDDYYLETVARDKAWFAGTIPLMDAFWHDVEEAKAGRFVLPEKKVSASAKPKKGPAPLTIMDDDDDVDMG
jgi:hypothetical protein